MAHETRITTAFNVLGAAIGLPPAAAEMRFNALPVEAQKEIKALCEGSVILRADIIRAFSLACSKKDRAAMEAMKATDAKHDKLDEAKPE